MTLPTAERRMHVHAPPRMRAPACRPALHPCFAAQTSTQAPPAPKPEPPQIAPIPEPPTRADILRGANGPYRANNDLLYYHLTLKVDPAAKSIAGTNLVRFRMLADATRIQLDLTDQLQIDKILLEGSREGSKNPLRYTRDYWRSLHRLPPYPARWPDLRS